MEKALIIFIHLLMENYLLNAYYYFFFIQLNSLIIIIIYKIVFILEVKKKFHQ